jgi:hypothetical protein
MDPIELEHYNKSRLETFSDLKCVEDPRDWDESPGEGWTPELDA